MNRAENMMSRARAGPTSGQFGEPGIFVAEAEPGGRDAEARVWRRKADIGRQRRGQAAANAEAFNQRDERLFEGRQPVVGATGYDTVLVFLSRGSALGVEFGDVGAGYEGFAACAAHDRDPDVGIAGVTFQHVADALPHLQRQRVVPFRLIENQPANAVIVDSANDFFGIQLQFAAHAGLFRDQPSTLNGSWNFANRGRLAETNRWSTLRVRWIFRSPKSSSSSAKRYAESAPTFPTSTGRNRTRRMSFRGTFYNAMAESGWIGVAIPEAYGGSGRGITEASLVLEEVAASGAAMNGATAVHLSIFGMHPVVKHGSEDMKQKYLPPVARGELHVAFGVTEPNAGTDTTAIETFARKDGDQYLVRGRKVWTTKALVSDRVLLLVRTTPKDKSASAPTA